MNTTVVEPDYNLQEFPLNCEQCEQLGYFFIEDINKSSFIICQQCSGETSNVWCPKCGMGGPFIRNIEQRPTAWACPNCHTKYSLPPNFYKKPVPLFEIEELPLTIQERIKRAEEAARPKFTLAGIFFLFVYVVITLVLLLWPFGLGFWLFVRTNNLLWFISGLVVLFAWLRFGRSLVESVLSWLSNISKKVNAI